MNATTGTIQTSYELLSFGSTDVTNGTIPEYECNDMYLIGLSVLTGSMAFISECMSLSKCGGDGNGIIDSVKKCVEKFKKNNEDDKNDII